MRIREVHLEEDAGKMIHAGDITLLDYNRTGTPLLEIVTQPDLEVGEEAEVFLQQLRRMVRYLGVCDGNMEEGSLRCDANVSVNLEGKGLGSKVEVKNLNSFKFVRKAMTFEIERQTEILERGGTRDLRRRGCGTRTGTSPRACAPRRAPRTTATSPSPTCRPSPRTRRSCESVEESLVELPEAAQAPVHGDLQLSEEQADFLCEEKATADYFEKTVAPRGGAAERGAVAGLRREEASSTAPASALADSPLTPARFAELLTLLAEKRIHGKIAKSVLEAVFAEDKDPAGDHPGEGLGADHRSRRSWAGTSRR